MPIQRGLTYDANNRVVSPGSFETMRIPLRRGRLFNDTDGRNSPPVAVINETMARILAGAGSDRQAVPARVPREGPGIPDCGHRWRCPADEPERTRAAGDVFRLLAVQGQLDDAARVVIRTVGDPLSLAAAVRHVVWSINPRSAVSNIMTLDDLLDPEVAQRRIQALLLGGLAALALVLACVGIYGVLSYLVVQRTQEIGVRVALGANTADVFRTVAGQGMGLTGIGVAVGLAGSLALSSVLKNLLFGVRATTRDLSGFGRRLCAGGVVGLLCAGAAGLEVDPMVALRYE